MSKELLKRINDRNAHTMMEWMQIEYTEFTGETLTAEMEVNERVHQPYGILHGGASAAMAESVGSFLSALQCDNKTHGSVGTNINSYHLKSINSGKVFAKASFVRKGRSLHVINIDIVDEKGNLVNKSVLTCKIIEIKNIS